MIYIGIYIFLDLLSTLFSTDSKTSHILLSIIEFLTQVIRVVLILSHDNSRSLWSDQLIDNCWAVGKGKLGGRSVAWLGSSGVHPMLNSPQLNYLPTGHWTCFNNDCIGLCTFHILNVIILIRLDTFLSSNLPRRAWTGYRLPPNGLGHTPHETHPKGPPDAEIETTRCRKREMGHGLAGNRAEMCWLRWRWRPWRRSPGRLFQQVSSVVPGILRCDGFV